jgi:hypothetical protein
VPRCNLSRKERPNPKDLQEELFEVAGLGNSLDLLVFVGEADRYVATAYFCAYSFRMLGVLIWPLN